MNKKLIKALSIFVIAGAIGTGAAFGIVGCKNNDKPDEEQEQPSATVTAVTAQASKTSATVGEEITLTATVSGTGDFSQSVTWAITSGEGSLSGNKLTATAAGTVKVQATSVTDTTKKSAEITVTFTAAAAQGLVVPDGVNGIVIEGITEETVTLSSTKTSHDIDKGAIKAYFATNGTKGDEIPAANLEISLYKNGIEEITTWTGLKDDADYVIVATLINAKTSAGATAELEGEITVTVSNPISSIALKSGTTTQTQGANVMTDWEFEATRANGDKVDVNKEDVTIGVIDTNSTGTRTVNITYGDVTGTVEYIITADDTKVSQSYAMNFGYLTSEQETAIKNGEVVTLQDGRFEIQSKSGGEVASHGKEYEGKYFAKRLKVNGASTASGAPRYIKVHADGAGTITVIAYNNSGAVGDGSTRGVALYGTRTAAESSTTGDVYTNQIGTTADIPSKEHSTATFTISEAGDYYITCDAGMTFCYVQLDQLLDAGEGVQEVTLGGENDVSKISVTAPANVSAFKVNDTFSHEGYTVTATAVNKVTCASGEVDVTNSAEFTAPDMTTIGKKEVTVSYQGVTATYNITVESAVDGIYGATATLSSEVNTQVSSADGKVTITKEDIVVTLLGSSEAANYTYTVKNGDAEITDGSELAIGDYALTVTVSVSDGTNSDTIVCTVPVKVEQTADVGAAQSFLVPDDEVTGDAKTITTDGAIADNTLFRVTASADMNYNIGKDASAGVGNSSKPVTVTLQDDTSKTFKQGISTMTDTAGSATSSDITITAKTKVSLRIYVTFCNNSYNSDRPADINYSVGDSAAQKISVSARATIAVIEVTVEEGQTVTINATNTGSSGGRLWLFGVEGTAVA